MVKLAIIKKLTRQNKKIKYWTDFGYMYEGPAALAFIQWIHSFLTGNPNKDVIFVARDGYTLQKIFNNLYGEKWRSHYIYAPRALNLICQLNFERTGRFAFEHTKTLIEYYRNKARFLKKAPQITSGAEGVAYIDKHIDIFRALAKKEKQQYRKYLVKQKIQSSEVAVVDTVSMFYSAQNFISDILSDKKIQGFYYQIQAGADDNVAAFSYKAKDNYSPDLSLIEFMMSSPEPPILHIENGRPVYKEPITKQEKQREITCEEMSRGALAFVADLKNFYPVEKIFIAPEIITDWIMLLVNHPAEDDKDRFLQTLCAYDPEHKDYRPIFPEWYNKRIRQSVSTPQKVIIATKIIFLGIPFYVIKYEQETLYKIGKLLLVAVKCKGSVYRYKLFNLIPIWKIRKIYR